MQGPLQNIRTQGCSVDPNSGDLAVVGYPPPNSTAPAKVLVFKGASGKPNVYKAKLDTTSFCGCDNSGNLFMTGYGYKGSSPFGVVSFNKGTKQFKKISFAPSGPFFGFEPGPVQRDGQHVAIGTPVSVVQYDISGFNAVEKGTTTFSKLHILANAWIQGGKIIVVNRGGALPSPPVQIYKYPAGGPSLDASVLFEAMPLG